MHDEHDRGDGERQRERRQRRAGAVVDPGEDRERGEEHGRDDGDEDDEASSWTPRTTGSRTPRVLATRTGDQSSGSRGWGSSVSATLEYIRMKIAISGMLRTNSTYHWAAVLTMKFCDSRAMPMSVPTTVASSTPDDDESSGVGDALLERVGTDWVVPEVAVGDREPGAPVEVVEVEGRSRCRTGSCGARGSAR